MGGCCDSKRFGGELLMADYIVSDTELEQVADAIRLKSGASSPLQFPDGFVDEIEGIGDGESGGSGSRFVIHYDQTTNTLDKTFAQIYAATQDENNDVVLCANGISTSPSQVSSSAIQFVGQVVFDLRNLNQGCFTMIMALDLDSADVCTFNMYRYDVTPV